MQMVETSTEKKEMKRSVALSSVLASFALIIMKLIVGLMTGSIGILSEAAHSLLDLGAAILTYFAVKVGDKPADETHHYGHGKVESISALVETGLLFVTSAWIMYEAVHRLMSGNIEVEATWYAFLVMIISIVVDYSRSRALIKVAKATNSQALEADALHFSSDIWSSAVVLLGLVFVLFGIKGADAIAAIGVAVFVIFVGYKLGKRTIDTLINAAPAGITEVVKDAIKNVKGIVSVDKIRVMPLGPSVFINISIKISRKDSVEKAHEIIKQIENKIHEKLPDSDIVVHTKPSQLDNETLVDSIQVLASKQSLFIHDIVVEKARSKIFISYDIEMPENLSVRQAHYSAALLETAIRKELGKNVVLNSHIEPLSMKEIASSLISPKEAKKIRGIIISIDGSCSPLYKFHNISVRKIKNKLFVTLHCLVKGNISLEEAHNASSHLEYLIKKKIPSVKRAVIHVEPSRNDD